MRRAVRCSAVYSLAESVLELQLTATSPDPFDTLFGALLSTRWLGEPHALLERLPPNEQSSVQVVAHVFAPSLRSLHAALRAVADTPAASGRSRSSASFTSLLAMAHQLEWTRALLSALKFAEPSALLALLQRNRRRLESAHNSYEELLVRFIDGVRSSPADGARSSPLSGVGNEDLSLMFWRFASSSCSSLQQLRHSFHELLNLFKSASGSTGVFQPYVQSSNGTALALLLRREQLRATQSLRVDLERVDLQLPATLPAAVRKLYVDDHFTMLPMLLSHYSRSSQSDDELTDAAQVRSILRAAASGTSANGAADSFYPKVLALILFLSAQLAVEMLAAELKPLLRMPCSYYSTQHYSMFFSSSSHVFRFYSLLSAC